MASMENFDVDVVVKVLENALFSPFFAFFVPVTFKSQGLGWSSPAVVNSSIYFICVLLFALLRLSSRVWRNGRLMSEKLDWGEQVVVVTGGASGIGALLADTLAIRNVTVAVLDISPVVSENDNIVYYKCDVSKWDEVSAVAKRITEEIGHPTVLVNNAGVVQGKLVLDLEPADIEQTFDTNVLAHFWTLKAFLPNMIKEKTGHIVTMSSVMGLVGAAQVADYCASKAAVIGLHESLRYELDHRYNTPSIRTTLVLPGHTHTPLFSRATLPQSAWFRFLAPSLHPHTVVKAIIAALDEHESRTIRLPFFTNFVGVVRLLPSWARDFFQWISYADYTMQGFVKVSGRRADEGAIPSVESRSEHNGKAQ